MNGNEFDPQATIDAMGPMLGLAVAPEDRDDVAGHLALARRIAAEVLAVETADDAEPAPVFRP